MVFEQCKAVDVDLVSGNEELGSLVQLLLLPTSRHLHETSHFRLFTRMSSRNIMPGDMSCSACC